jgi:hypothetical protein
MNKRYSTAVATLAIVTIMATGTIAPLLGQTLQTASAQLVNGFTKIVRDNPAGNAVGWDPDGLKHTFVIDDPEVTVNDTILINTHQDNFVVCSVDYRPNFGSFEVNCIETTPGFEPPIGNITVLEGGPDDGAILFYTVITANNVPVTVSPADLLAQAQNATAERRERAEESPR